MKRAPAEVVFPSHHIIRAATGYLWENGPVKMKEPSKRRKMVIRKPNKVVPLFCVGITFSVLTPGNMPPKQEGWRCCKTREHPVSVY